MIVIKRISEPVENRLEEVAREGRLVNTIVNPTNYSFNLNDFLEDKQKYYFYKYLDGIEIASFGRDAKGDQHPYIKKGIIYDKINNVLFEYRDKVLKD